MAVGKEIRGKIKSVENTRRSPRPWKWWPHPRCARRSSACAPPVRTARRSATLPPTGKANPEYTHPFMQKNEAKNAGFIVVTTDKGLCGGLNTNMLRGVTAKLREMQGAGMTTEAVAIGNKGLGFLNRIGARVVSHVTHLGDTAAYGQAHRPRQGAAGCLCPAR